MPITEAALYAVCDRPTLFAFLRASLGWPVDPEDTFTYSGPQLHGPTATRAQVSQIIPFTAGDPFTILLVEFQTAFRRTDLREILRCVREEIRTRAKYGGRSLEEIIFVCAEENYAGIRFAHFEARQGQQPKLEVFGWDRNHQEGTRTLRDVNLPALMMPPANLIGEHDWTTGRKQWLSAWDVERVTNSFFRQYREVFEGVERAIRGEMGDRRLFTQRLFNRLLFLRFLAKKGWLYRDPHYIRTLWETARPHATGSIAERHNFYADYLCPLFFRALNTPTATRPTDPEWSELSSRLGDVPFLNGGLFEKDKSGCDDPGVVTIPNDAFLPLLDLFEQYNFTITESTPDDVEVAVDPEMLGRVFEELVTGRHETGSYYTPRPVVAFMCREALKGYLAHNCLRETPDALAAFVDNDMPDGLRDSEAVSDALRSVTVCDPACGSGAYLLGMMQELLRLRESLFRAKVKDHRKIYDRKLEIIQRNLYGVDKEEFAVNVAMLRLWLSLVVDNETNVEEVLDGRADVSLPNLKFKIQQGDSLSAPAPDPAALTLHRDEYAADAVTLRRLYDEYFRPADGRNRRPKSDVEGDIDRAQAQIADLLGTQVQYGVLDWRIAFAEVFAPSAPAQILGAQQFAFANDVTAQQAFVDGEESGSSGFDIILANPPYVRADAQFKHLLPDETARRAAIEKWKQFREELKKSQTYETLYEKWDLYIPFLERAFQLLTPGGRMVFIIPDAYNANKYTMKSHAFFLAQTCVERIDFCTEIPLFDAGVTNTIVHFAKTSPGAKHAPVRVRRFGDTKNDFEKNVEFLSTMLQTEFGETLFKASGEKNEEAGEGTIPLEQLCYISVGMVIHADERRAHGAFTASELISPIKDALHPKAYLEGKNLAKWVVREVSFLEYYTDRAPSLFRRPTFPELYEVPEKLVSMDLSGAGIRVAYDDKRLYHNHSAWSFVLWYHLASVRNKSIKKTAKYRNEVKPGEVPPTMFREELEKLSKGFALKYLLGIMNSSFAKTWISKQRRNRLHIYPDDWKGLPIAPATPEQQTEIAALVQKCLDAKGIGCEVWEKEIDERVAALYGL